MRAFGGFETFFFSRCLPRPANRSFDRWERATKSNKTQQKWQSKSIHSVWPHGLHPASPHWGYAVTRGVDPKNSLDSYFLLVPITKRQSSGGSGTLSPVRETRGGYRPPQMVFPF